MSAINTKNSESFLFSLMTFYSFSYDGYEGKLKEKREDNEWKCDGVWLSSFTYTNHLQHAQEDLPLIQPLQGHNRRSLKRENGCILVSTFFSFNKNNYSPCEMSTHFL